MPIYEYECLNGHRIEVMHGIDASGPATCATCGAPLHKLLARPAIVFKGSGWAKKDARSSAGRTPAARSTAGDESAARTGGEATDAKDTKPSGSKTDGPQNRAGAGEGSGKRDASSSAPASAAGPPERD